MNKNIPQKLKVASYYKHIDNGGLYIDVTKEVFNNDPESPFELYTIEFSSDYFGYPSVKSVIGPIYKEYLDFYLNSFKDLSVKV